MNVLNLFLLCLKKANKTRGCCSWLQGRQFQKTTVPARNTKTVWGQHRHPMTVPKHHTVASYDTGVQKRISFVATIFSPLRLHISCINTPTAHFIPCIPCEFFARAITHGLQKARGTQPVGTRANFRACSVSNTLPLDACH